MQRWSIDDLLRGLPAEASKHYATSLNSHGFESGVGRSGEYEGHAHRFMWDLIFAPSGLALKTADNSWRQGTLLVVAPETFFGPVGLGPFWFLKFAGRPGPVTMPDKLLEPLARGGIWLFGDSGLGEMPWYPLGHPQPSRVTFSLSCGNLEVTLGGRILQVAL